MAEEHSGTIDELDHGETTAQWQRTLWAIVGIQFINTMAFLREPDHAAVPAGARSKRRVLSLCGPASSTASPPSSRPSPRRYGDASPTAAAAS